MKIAVIGLGNVGLVTALCLSHQGHQVIGIEIHPQKVEQLKRKETYLFEPGLDELLQKAESLVVSTELSDAEDADAFIICVGTPARADGSVELSHVLSTMKELSSLLQISHKDRLVIVRSTLPPGTMKNVISPLFSSSKNIQLVFHPEFLREGNAVSDFQTPEYHVVGLQNDRKIISDSLKNILGDEIQIYTTDFATAEMLKYINNSFHALKVAFANEVASIASSLNVDVTRLTEIFLEDSKQNISPMYLRPGFSFGGPCLQKELTALNSFARQCAINAPLIRATLDSNMAHTRRLMETLDKLKARKILFVGLSFKPNTDDLRNSPIKETLDHILQRPSYQQSSPIFVMDIPKVQKKLEHYQNITFVSNLEEALNDLDVIVLGPYRLNEQAIEQLRTYRGKVIDLGYFSYNFPNEINVIRAYDGVRS